MIYTKQIMFSYDPLVKILRLECQDGESVDEALDRLGIDNAKLIFEGWPKLPLDKQSLLGEKT